MNFAGWETKIIDQSGYIAHPQYLSDEHIQGRIAYQLPAGTFIVNTFFTQNTMPRIIGNTVTLFTSIGVLIWIIMNRKTTQYGTQK